MKGDNSFFDTNILVYCFERLDTRKQVIAHELVLEEGLLGRGTISYQVHQEFASVTIRRLKNVKDVRRMLAGFEHLAFGLTTVAYSEALFRHALDLWERHSLSWYDSLIVSAALTAHCATLYTEDMQHGLEIDGMRIVNPFL